MKDDYSNDLVSVVMPLFNSEMFLSESIDSVLRQTHRNFELIIVDNLSTDQSLCIAQEYQRRDNRIKVYQCALKGASHARNIGIKESGGRYVAFLDSDDIWLDTKLERQLNYMSKNNCTLSCTSYIPFLSGSQSFLKRRDVSGLLSYRQLLKTCQVGCSTVIFDKIYHRDVLFPLVPKEDYALWLKMCRDGTSFGCVSDALTYYRVSTGSISSNKFKEAFRQWNIYRNQENLTIFHSVYYLINYAYHGVKKRG